MDELLRHWGLTARAVRPLPAGDRKQCWAVTTTDAAVVVLALHPRATLPADVTRERELAARAAAREVTPEPLRTTAGPWAVEHDGQLATVTRWAPGADGYGAPLAAARLQARLHATPVPRDERGPLVAPRLTEACALLADAPLLPARVARPAALLATHIAGGSWPHALIHGDLHPRNVRVANHSARLVDLDGAGWGVRVYDLALAAVFFTQRHPHELEWRPAAVEEYLAAYHAAGGQLEAAELRAVTPMVALAVCAEAARHAHLAARAEGDERLLESAVTTAAELLADPAVAELAPPWEGSRGLPLTGGLTAWVDRLVDPAVRSDPVR